MDIAADLSRGPSAGLANASGIWRSLKGRAVSARRFPQLLNNRFIDEGFFTAVQRTA